MDKLAKAVLLMALLPVSLFAQENNDSISMDSIADYWDKVLELNEVVVIGHRTVLKQEPDRIVYLTKNDAFTKGLNGIEVLDRIPRVTVEGDAVTVAGKSSVRYIVDGRRHRASRKSKYSPHHQQNMLQAPMWRLSASPHATSRLARVAACGVVALLVRISVICWAAIYLTQLAKLNYRSMPVGVITGALMTLTAPTHSAITIKSRNVAHTSLIVRLV